MKRKALPFLFALLFVQLTAISKQIPGSYDTIYETRTNGKHLLINHGSHHSIYDIDGDSLLSSIGGSGFAAATENNFHYYANDSLFKCDIKTGNVLMALPILKELNIDRRDFWDVISYSTEKFIIRTKNSFYLLESIENGYDIQLLFNVEDDFIPSNNVGIYYNDGQIIYLDDDGNPKSFPHEFETGVRVFSYSGDHIIYHLKEDHIDYLASYNIRTKTKKRIEQSEAYKFVIVGDKVVTYSGFIWVSVSVMSFDLFRYFDIQIADYPVNFLTPIDDSKLAATSTQNSKTFIYDIDTGLIKLVNRFSASIDAIVFSEDSRYLGVINPTLVDDFGTKVFKVIDMLSRDIIYEYYYSTENFVEELFYNKEHGFVFQSSDYEIGSFIPNSDTEVKRLIKTEKEITAHNLNDEYLFVGHDNQFDMYKLLDMKDIYSIETDGKIDLIRYNSKFVIFNSLIGFKNNGRESALFRLDLNDFESDSIFLGNHINLKLGSLTAPLFGFNEKFMFQIENHNYVWFLKLDEESLGENRVLNGEKFGAIVAVNDSVYICSSRDEPHFIKKVKFNYDDLEYEVLEDYQISFNKIKSHDGGEFKPDIRRLSVNDKYIAYADDVENTIRIIEDNDLVTTVETYETIDYDEFNQMLESGLYEVNVYDLNGRELFNETSSNFGIEKLDRNRPYLINIYNDNTNKVFKLIR